MRKALGLLGGAFDPIHVGHLRGAISAREILDLERVDLVPAAQSPLKQACGASAEHRLAMIKAATNRNPWLGCDSRELNRPGPSFTFETLAELRQTYGPLRPLIWIIGADIVPTLPNWARWPQLLSLAHFAIIGRPNSGSYPPAVGEWLTRHAISKEQVNLKASGGVLIIDQPLLEIASSDLRSRLATGHDPQFLLPDVVLEYIRAHDLYIYEKQ